MTPSLLAILARFDGDRKQARKYCAYLAAWYPDLAEEYGNHIKALEEQQ